MNRSVREADRTPPIPTPARDTGIANDRMKARWQSWFWGSMIVAISVHFAVFALWPEMSVSDTAMNATVTEIFEIPLELRVPPPPEAVRRPATPQIADFDVSPDLTIGETTFDANRFTDLARPPDSVSRGSASRGPILTPYTVAPDLQNRPEVARVLEREYPPLLKDSRIGGTVLVWLYVDADGVVQDRRVAESSGYDAFDAAALKVADRMRFSPAWNRDKKVAVWVAIPIDFRIRDTPEVPASPVGPISPVLTLL